MQIGVAVEAGSPAATGALCAWQLPGARCLMFKTPMILVMINMKLATMINTMRLLRKVSKALLRVRWCDAPAAFQLARAEEMCT
jgi:hypothetical protein